MRKFAVFMFFGVAVVFIQTGCESFSGNKNVDYNTKQIKQLNYNTKVLKKHLARAQSRVNYYEEETAKLNGKIEDLQHQQIKNKQQIRVLEDQIIKMGQLQQKIAKEISTLKKSMSAESKSIQNELNKIVDQVAKETATAINSLRKTQMKSATRRKGPIGKGDFYVHTVQKGHTLGAIAKAYKVQIADIRKANGLKNDVIRIGQKLYIPKKK